MRTNKTKLTLTQNKQTSSPPSEQENEKDPIRFSTWVRVIPLLAIPRRPVREAPRPQPTSRRRRREWAGRLWYSGTLTKTTPLPSASSSRKISLLSTPGTTTIGPRSMWRPSMAGSTWPNAWSSTALTSTLRIAGKIRYFFFFQKTIIRNCDLIIHHLTLITAADSLLEFLNFCIMLLIFFIKWKIFNWTATRNYTWFQDWDSFMYIWIFVTVATAASWCRRS